MILKNEVFIVKDQKLKVVSSLFFVVICEDFGLLKYFVGFIFFQFEVLCSFLNDVCLMEKINYWNFGEFVNVMKLINGFELQFIL